jgi:hypothetical protein
MTSNKNPILSTPWDKRDWIICLILGSSALLLFCVGRNPEIQGDDDYLYVANFSMITDAILAFDLSSFKSFGASIVKLMEQILSAPRHAPLPSLISAVFYAVCYSFHVPFSLNLLHVPIAVISALSVLLLYGLMRRNKQRSRVLCYAGTFLLLLSPIFVISSRALAEYHLAFIPFTTLIGLWGLDVLNRSDSPHWPIGLALAQIVLSDIIWFTTLPVLLFAFVWAARDRKQAMIQLLSMKVLGPVLITACLLLLGTWIAYEKGLSTPLLKLLLEHGSKLSTGSPVIMSPIYLAECLSVQMGIVLPLLLPLGIVLWWIDGRRLLTGLLTAFGLTGLLIYGIIFYGLTPERSSVKIAYQIYLLVPLVIISIDLMSIIRNRFRRGSVWVAWSIAALLFFEILACVNLTWKFPVSPLSHIFTQWHHGTFAPNQGTKATGYLVRQWIEAAWRQNSNQPVTVYASHYNMSFAIFSGFNVGEKGWVFIREFGHNRPITVFSTPHHQNHQEPFPARDKTQFVYLLDLTAALPRETDITKLTQDPSGLLRYEIRSSSSRNGTAVVYVRPTEGIMPPPISPGVVNMEQLESRYDRAYYRYSDFFPRSLAAQ